MLRGPAFRWSEDELLQLRLVDRQAYFYSNLLAAAIDIESPLRSRASEVIAALKRWQDWSAHLNMEELFVQLFDELDLLEIAAVRPGGDQRRRNLEALLDRAREFDGFLRKGLSRFLRYLDDLIEEGRDFAAPSAIPENADVVRIMTIHASKGMEFPIVILPWIGARFNDSGRRRAILWDRGCGISSRLTELDDEEDNSDADLLHELIQQERARKETCEELRLLYVALTRARESVHLIGSFKQRHFEALVEQGAAGEKAAEVILSGRCYGDWVLPWAVELAGQAPQAGSTISFGPATLRCVAESELREGLAWARRVGQELERLRSVQAVTRTDWEALIASTDALDPSAKTPDAPMDPALVAEFAKAAERIAELQRQPPNPLLRAKISVTEAKRAYEAHRDESTPAYAIRESAAGGGVPEWVPPGFGGKPALVLDSGPQLGTITHRFLANLDLAPMGKSIRLKEEVARQVTEGLLSPEEAAVLRLPDVAAFFGTAAGSELLQQMGRVHRERAFTAKVEGGRLHPLAVGRPVILQGILDVLYRRTDGWVILDYKTDFIRSPEHLAELRRAYSIQMVLYKLLVETTLEEPVVAGRLAFLRERQVVDVDWNGISVPWEEILQASAVLFPEASSIDPAIKWL
jgi:ATP-dependent helicase/nuclease subunit A